MKIVIDVDDWEDEYDKFGRRVDSKEALIEISQEEGRPTPHILGRLALIDREKHGGRAVRASKILLNIGAGKEVNQIISKAITKVKLKNGKPAAIRTFVCPVRRIDEDEDADENNSVSDSMSKEGYEKAVKYIKNILPGIIYGRLVIIAASPFNENGAVREYAEWLKAKIDEMVDGLEVSVS